MYDCRLSDAVCMIVVFAPTSNNPDRCLHTLAIHNTSQLQASIACYEPKQAPAVVTGFQPKDMHAATNRHTVQKACINKEDAYLRTGAFRVANPASEADKLQGKGRKRYPLFAADSPAARKKAKAAEDVCTKHKHAAGAMSHGVQVRTPSDH